jgi:hypothetical protein
MAVMYKATKSFSGLINMKKGDVKEIKDEEIANDLLRAGYVMALEDEKPLTKATSKKSAKKADSKDGE